MIKRQDGNSYNSLDMFYNYLATIERRITGHIEKIKALQAKLELGSSTWNRHKWKKRIEFLEAEIKYEQYKRRNINYKIYKETICRFNKIMVEKILDGHTLYMGNKLGEIRIRKVRRNPDRPTIDWGETNKLKKQGINRYVYFTDDWWYRWYWRKRNAQVKNKSVYSFRPTRGGTGNMRRLSNLLTTDEFAKLKFKE